MGLFWNKEEKSDVELYMEQRNKQQQEEDSFEYKECDSEVFEKQEKLSWNIKKTYVERTTPKSKKSPASIIKTIIIIFVIMEFVFTFFFMGIVAVMELAVKYVP